MVSVPAQGEVWWAESVDKRRPVLVITRSETIPSLRSFVVAPVTRSVRDIQTEVALGPAEGLGAECAASFDNVQAIGRSLLTKRIGQLGVDRRSEVCRALAALADC